MGMIGNGRKFGVQQVKMSGPLTVGESPDESCHRELSPSLDRRSFQ